MDYLADGDKLAELIGRLFELGWKRSVALDYVVDLVKDGKEQRKGEQKDGWPFNQLARIHQKIQEVQNKAKHDNQRYGFHDNCRTWSNE